MKFTRAIPLVLSVIAFQSVSAAPLAPSAYHRRSDDLDARKLTGAELGQAAGAAGAVITAIGAVTTGLINLFKGKNKRDFDAQDFTKNLEILKLLTARDTPKTEMIARDPVVTLLDLLTSGSELSRRDDDDDDSFDLGSILDMVEKAVGKVDEVKTGFKDIKNEFKGAFKGDGAAKVLGTTTVSAT